MEDVNTDACELECQPGGQFHTPGVFVVVATDHVHGRDFAQGFDHCGASYVAGVDDVFHAG
jgi:hypothetical protein